MLTYAEQMLFVEEEIKQRVANPSEAEGLFRIGASETVARVATASAREGRRVLVIDDSA